MSRILGRILPISPGDIAAHKEASIPSDVIKIFNNLIVEDYGFGSSATVLQEDVVSALFSLGYSKEEIFQKGWLNVEGIFEKAGWSVEYDKPGFNESYKATYTFTEKTK